MWKCITWQATLALVFGLSAFAQTSSPTARPFPDQPYAPSKYTVPKLEVVSPSQQSHTRKAHGKAAANTLYAVSDTSTGDSLIFSISNYSVSPVAVPIATFSGFLADIDIDPTTNDVYVIDGDGTLYQLDLDALTATTIGIGVSGETSLAFNRNGQAYEWGADQFLYRVDKNTGTTTAIGDTGYEGAGDLAFDLDGTLFGTTTDGNLVRIDPNTGNSTLVGPTGFEDFYGLAIDSSRTLYGGRSSSIYVIDKARGTSYFVGDIAGISNEIHGLALAVPPSPPSLPNLIPYQPQGWSDKIVISLSPNSRTDSTNLTNSDALYLNFAIANIGTSTATPVFYSEIFIDGKPLSTSWYDNPPFNANSYATVTGYSIGQLPQGTHTVQLSVDSTNSVAESNENDNEYTKTIQVGPASSTQPGLQFPLKAYSPNRDRGLDPYSTQIISVFDHSMADATQTSNPFRPYRCDHSVVAFTGERGSLLASDNDPLCRHHPGYSQDHTAPFTINNHYVGSGGNGQLYLNYDGHPGYDFVAANGTQVYAAASGTVHYPVSHIGLSDAYNTFHVLEIIPDQPTDYRVFYLHLSTHPSPSGAKGSFTDPSPKSGCPKQVSLPLPEGTHVTAGCLVALSGGAGTADSSGHTHPHLHFEVHHVIPKSANSVPASSPMRCVDDPALNDSSHACIPVDPYGWSGSYADPYMSLTGVGNSRLWEVAPHN